MRLNVAGGYIAPVVHFLPPALVMGRYWCSKTRKLISVWKKDTSNLTW